jgi:hypothetical protein
LPSPAETARGNRADRHCRGVSLAVAAVVLVTAAAASAGAQTVEVTPFGGYRFGGSFGEIPAGTVVDDDGGASVGVIVNVDIGRHWEGVKLEGVYSRQRAGLSVRSSSLAPPTRVTAIVDQVLIGGIRDLGTGRARTFLSGLLGLTRYAVPGDTEVRFAIGAGTGVKAYLNRNIGLRLDLRGYLTVVDLNGGGVCGGGGCRLRFSVNPAFQGDATAGLLIAF